VTTPTTGGRFSNFLPDEVRQGKFEDELIQTQGKIQIKRHKDNTDQTDLILYQKYLN